MNRKDVDAICAALPGATEAHPPELVSWKVGGKMFVCFGGEGNMDGASVKTPDTETAAMLIDAGAAQKAPYFHASWVRLPFATTKPEDMRHRINLSYDLIRKSLRKPIRDALPPREPS